MSTDVYIPSDVTFAGNYILLLRYNTLSTQAARIQVLSAGKNYLTFMLNIKILKEMDMVNQHCDWRGGGGRGK